MGAGALAAMGVAATVAPQCIRPAADRRLRVRCRERRMVCLTFDDGPGPDLTPRALELLSKHDVPATFYLLGFRAEAAPRVADLVRAGGHEIGAHTMRHLHAWKHTPWACYRDVCQGYRTLAPWLSERARFRPPYGKLNIGSWAALSRLGVPIDWWTVDSGDTWDKLPDPASVADRIVREQGGVVLLHDFDRVPNTGQRADYVLRTADMIIHRARDSGLRFGTMSDLSGD